MSFIAIVGFRMLPRLVGMVHDVSALVRNRTRTDMDGRGFHHNMQIALGLDEHHLRSSSRSEELVVARVLLTTLGVEQYRLKVKTLAEHLRKSPDGMSHALARGVRKRAQDDDFRNRLNDLDPTITRSITTIAE